MDEGIAYDALPSLWTFLLSYVPSSEHEEMRRVLGPAIIDENSVLHDEASALLSIWRDVRGRDGDESLAQPSHASLPEPPLMRELVTNEVRFLAENLSRVVCGSCNDDAISKVSKVMLTQKESDILSHVLRTTVSMNIARASNSIAPETTPVRPTSARVGTRPKTALGADGTITLAMGNMHLKESGLQQPERQRTRGFDDIKAFSEHLNIFNIDNVVDKIRAALHEEKDVLLSDIEFLHAKIEEEYDFQYEQQNRKPENVATLEVSEKAHSITRPPLLHELRALASVLQQRLRDTSNMVATTSPKPFRANKTLAPLKVGSRAWVA